MTNAFLSGGILMWPLLLIGVAVMAMGARTAWLLARGKAEDPAAESDRRLHGILFWGAMAVVLGLLGTVVGIIQIAQAVTLAGEAHAPLLWGGFGVSLVTLVFGLFVFTVAAVLWFALRQWSLRSAAKERVWS